jgi:hypothetical protein
MIEAIKVRCWPHRATMACAEFDTAAAKVPPALMAERERRHLPLTFS